MKTADPHYQQSAQHPHPTRNHRRVVLSFDSMIKYRPMESQEALIRAHNLTKRFGNFTAVDKIDFRIYKGECVGFLGPNGAGKTTTVRMIYCFLPTSEGELDVAGMDVTKHSREVKSLIGVAPQEDNLDPDFSVLKNLIVYARYFDIPKDDALKRAEEQLTFFGMQEKRDSQIDELSTGMKRRLVLARALINKPQILLLDEPTTGLDPQARHLVWNEVRSLRKLGVTIIITTHYMEEAAELCDRVLIIDNGKIIEQGRPSDLVKKHVGEDVLEIENDRGLLETLKKEFSSATFEVVGDRIHVFSTQPHGFFERYVALYKGKNVAIRNANLEDVFLKLTGRKLRD